MIRHLLKLLAQGNVRPVECRLDADGVLGDDGEGNARALPWAALAAVEIVTTEDGPFSEDLFWRLTDADGQCCCVPGGEAERIGLLTRLQELPGFDSTAVIAACCCVEEAVFPCWQAAA